MHHQGDGARTLIPLPAEDVFRRQGPCGERLGEGNSRLVPASIFPMTLSPEGNPGKMQHWGLRMPRPIGQKVSHLPRLIYRFAHFPQNP
jgi:hypothetical protein